MKKFLSFAALALLTSSLFTACDDDDDDQKIECYFEVTTGIVVVNEGSYYNKINGSVTTFSFADTLATQNVFQQANGRSLGSTPNDAVVVGDNIYITTTDENRVEIANANTMKSVAVVSVPQPREVAMASDASGVYVSSYSGRVYKIDANTYQLTDSSAVVGTNLEGIAVYGDYVYVCNAWNNDFTYNTNVVKLDASLNKLKDITVAANPTQIEVTADNIFVVSTGNYYDVAAVAQRILPATDEVTEIAPATMIAVLPNRLFLVNAPWGSTPTYSYADLSGTTIGSVQTWISGTDIVSPYAIAADVANWNVCISSSAADPDYGGASYTLPGYVVMYNADGEKLLRFDAGVNPGTMLFRTKWSQ